ncbi:unnamed protein product [Merluccius merluccius]
MKAPVRPTATKTQLGQKKRKYAYSSFIYTAQKEGRDVGAGASRALRTDRPGCPQRVLLGLVAQEACRLSKTSRRRRITPREVTAALDLVHRRTRARAAA